MYAKMSSSVHYGGGEGYISSKNLFKENYIERIRKTTKSNTHIMLDTIGFKFPMINTAACIYRRSALYDVNLFDEELNYHEDMDLSRRVFYAGYVLFSCKDARANCYNGSPKLSTFLIRHYFSGREFAKYSKKWNCLYP